MGMLAGGGAQEMEGRGVPGELQTHDVVTITFGTVVWVQLNDRNFCKFEVSAVSCSSNTIGPGSATMPSTRTRIKSLASPEEMTLGVALELLFVVVILLTWDTSMNKSSSAVGFLRVVVKTVCHFPSLAGMTVAAVLEVAAALVASSPAKA